MEQSLVKRLLNFPRKAVRRHRQEGLRAVLAWAYSHPETVFREWKLGIRTRGFIAPEALGYAHDSPGYDPIPFVCLDAALDALALDSRRDVFVDIGCGLGRAVVVAATRPFRQVWGIELNRQLAEQARQQLVRAQKKLLCQEVQIVEADAVTFDYPTDMNIIFLWNPFVGSILNQVMERIRLSYLQSPRPMTLLYAQPEDERDTLRTLPWLVFRGEVKTRFRTGVRIVTYEINPR